MTECCYDQTIGIDGLTVYQRWLKSDAPYKVKCKDGLCISYYHPINCKDCGDEE